MMKELFEKALGISVPWYIEKIVFDAETKRLDIHINFKKGAKFTYYDKDKDEEYKDLKAYDTKEKTWRHLNFFEHECYLHARVPRLRYGEKEIRQVELPWEGISKGFTLLFEALIVQLCMSMPINQVSKLTGVHNDKIWKLLREQVSRLRLEEDFSEIESIGIDETSRRKGHDYISLFVDLSKRRTIYVTKGKGSETVKEFKEDFSKHKGKASSIKKVSCDMSQAYIKGVKENLCNAEITFDKFHVLKLINDAVDKVRKSEVEEKRILKGTRYIWLKNRKNLTEKQSKKLKELTMSKMKLKTMRAYNIRESFQEIYKAESETEFITYLKKWYYWASHSRLEPIKKVAKTIKNHWSGIVNWYESKINNGILEGLNSVIQAAKSKARGYKTFENYQTMVYLLTGKLNFDLISKN